MFITLTDFDLGTPIYLVIEHITSFFTFDGVTYLYTPDSRSYTVKESAESIADRMSNANYYRRIREALS